MNNDFPWQEIESRFHQLVELGDFEFSYKQVTRENRALVRNLKNFSRQTAIPLIASLLTIPKYQTSFVRLETLVTLAAIHCHGRKVTRTVDVCRWHHMLQSSQTVLAEDTTGDMFVHLVIFEGEDFRMIGGTWNHSEFYVQRTLDVVETMPNEACFSRWKQTVRLLLNMSDQLCERSGLSRYQAGTAEYDKPILVQDLPSGDSLMSRTTFPLRDLSTAGEELELLESLILDEESLTELPMQKVDENDLVHKPLIVFNNNQFCIMLPTCIGDAIREFVLSMCLEHGVSDSFDQSLRQIYQRQLSTSNLLLNLAPVPTKKLETQDNQIAHTVVEIDVGHFIAIFSILPSVETLYQRVFDSANSTQDSIEKAITYTVREVISDVSSRPDFQLGRILYITCWWGLDSNLRIPEESYANWTSAQLSAADFDRMNYVRDISFRYLWKILDELETLQAQGIQFLSNLSLLTLVGWAQRLGGTLLPNEPIADSEVSLNELLESRFTLTSMHEIQQLAYQVHDIHVVRDNFDRSHTVVRVDPYNKSDSDLFVRLYRSMSDFTEHNKNTMFYDGNVQIWTTLITTDTISLEFEGYLFQLVNTWLARIGYAVDQFTVNSSVEAQVGRVDVKFESTRDPANTRVNPTVDELAAYCRIDYSERANAANIVFKAGFEAGFGDSENVAEQLVERLMIRAVLQISQLPIEDLNTFLQNIIPNKKVSPDFDGLKC